MITKTIKYTDYNGNEREEEFCFHLTKAEISEMNFQTVGGLEQMFKDMISTRDIPKMSAIIKDIILRSYGVKSPDGRRFIKSKELSTEFSQTEAYSVLYMELISDETAAAMTAFMNGILPANISGTKQPLVPVQKTA